MNTNEDAQGLQLLFERPCEPVFTPRGDGKIGFDVPESFLTERYKTVTQDLLTRFGQDKVSNRISLREIKQPDLSFTNDVPRDGGFSLFNVTHQRIAGELIKMFMDIPDLKSFISTAAYARDRINPYLFQYALSVASAHRKDTKNVQQPSVLQVFPSLFVDPKVFRTLREEATLVSRANREVTDIPFNYTASDREEEQRLAYFREDVGVNGHHWHWHLVYPTSGPTEVVKKDRRGELFFYMHQQIIARYNVERFCNKMARVKHLSNFREVIPEGYFPKIIRSSNNRAYPPRFSKTLMQDVNREPDFVEVSDLERWRDRIFEAISQGFVINAQGERIPLTEEKGIDILGDIVEASNLSPNQELYGSLHNQGHNVISFIHDPDSRHMEEYAVMGDVATAMRDPVFYRWHSFIDSIFQRYKLRLPSYTDMQLNYDGIQVQSLNIQMSKGANSPQNSLLTFWQKSQVDLGAGLDFGPQGNILAAFTHLNHTPFTYRIMANNTGAARKGTCRIFIAPRFDERGTALKFKEQRLYMVELDKFIVTLNPGSNTILRRSDQSSVTIPFNQSYRRVGADATPTDAKEKAKFQFCGCGWPHHLLVPRGTPEGADFDLFAMISNYTDDSINQTFEENEGGCDTAASFCGIRDKLYPDRRPMGYPFDRTHTATSLKEFVKNRSNMALQTVNIKFTNRMVNKTT